MNTPEKKDLQEALQHAVSKIPQEQEAFSNWYAKLFQELSEGEQSTLLYTTASDAFVLYNLEYDQQVQASAEHNPSKAKSLLEEKPRRTKKFQQVLSLLLKIIQKEEEPENVNQQKLLSTLNLLAQSDLKEGGTMNSKIHNKNGQLLKEVCAVILGGDNSKAKEVGQLFHKAVSSSMRRSSPTAEQNTSIKASEKVQAIIEASWIPALMEGSIKPQFPADIPNEWLNPSNPSAVQEDVKAKIEDILEQ